MAVWKNRDGVATHLKHTANMGGSHSGGGTECSGGEGDDHSRWKGLAADALEDAFNDIGDIDGFSEETKKELVKEKGVSAPVSDKERRVGDVVLTFTERDWQFGDGLIVEVQDKNKSKNRTLTTQDYVEQGFAVIWLYEDDFIQTQSDESPGKCRLGEVEFRHRARQAVKKYALKEQTLPWFDWVLSDDPYYDYLDRAVKPFTVATRSHSQQHCVPATFTPECIDTIIYNQLDWDSIEPVTDSAARYRLRAAIGTGTTTRVDAKVDYSVILPTEREYWRNNAWRARFTMRTSWTDGPVLSEIHEREAANMTEQSGSPATLPPDCSKGILTELYEEKYKIDTPEELREWACRYGWQQESGRSPYHNLKKALEVTSDHSGHRKTGRAFSAIHIRGLGGETTTQRALDKMADDDDCQTPLSTLSITAD
jgi:hypothetical protein